MKPMIVKQSYHICRNEYLTYVLVCVIGMIVTNIGLDYIFTRFRSSTFYISESLLFSTTFWILFIPFSLFLRKIVEGAKNKAGFVLIIPVSHLFAYPAFIWVLSKIFYDHTFSYWQTFSFSLSSYFITVFTVYAILFVVFSKHTIQKQLVESIPEKPEANFILSILVNDSNNMKYLLDVNDIVYFSANTPYVNIYHLSKTYLHTITLKSLQAQLNSQQFVRIHKSYIVNLSKIVSIQSRQNGDYDVMLSNGIVLRASRSYIKNFKLRFLEQHQLNTK